MTDSFFTRCHMRAPARTIIRSSSIPPPLRPPLLPRRAPPRRPSAALRFSTWLVAGFHTAAFKRVEFAGISQSR